MTNTTRKQRILSTIILVVVILIIIRWRRTSNDQDSIETPDDQVALVVEDAPDITLHSEERPVRILVVEDDISISRLIGLAMPELGLPYIFVGALSAEEGFELWQQEPFDLLLTDYNLPGMRGTELIATLKSRGVTAPMVLFTAYDSPKLAREVRKLGVFAYITKPFLMEDMLYCIKSMIYRKAFTEWQSSTQSTLEHVLQQPDVSLVVLGIAGKQTITALSQIKDFFPGSLYMRQTINSTEAILLFPTPSVEQSIQSMLEHFYASLTDEQYLDDVLTFGCAHGPCASVNDLIEAAARDYLRQRHEQMLYTTDEPEILLLQASRRELLQRYAELQATCEEYQEELCAQQDMYEQAFRIETERLSSIVNHDLNSGFMSLQRAVDDTASRLPTEAADALHFLHAVEEHILFCTAWRRSIIELGAGGVVQRQELSPGPWLAKHLPILHCCMGGQVQLDIDLANVPDAMVDKSLLLVACLHLLRAVDAAGASTLRVSTMSDQHEDRFDILFTDDGDADQRLACLAAYHPTQRAAFTWEYQNLSLLQRVLTIQDIEVRCEQHDAWFQMYWSVPKLTEPLADSFLTLEELRAGVVALEQEAEHLEKAVSALEELEDDTTPEDAQALLLPFVEHLEHSLGAMREQFLPSMFTTLHMVDTDVVQRIPRLILYCYLLGSVDI